MSISTRTPMVKQSLFSAPSLLVLMMAIQAYGAPYPTTRSDEHSSQVISGNNLPSNVEAEVEKMAQIDRQADTSIPRSKRSGISDQRLAELETLLALKRLRDQQMRSRGPVAYGVFDPDRIGKRRRRSAMTVLRRVQRLVSRSRYDKSPLLLDTQMS